MISAFVPERPLGNTLPNLFFDIEHNDSKTKSLLLSNFNSILYDYAARQKIQGQHLNWYIVEQIPVIPLARYKEWYFGVCAAAAVVQAAVLELTYTSHDMAPFAEDMGYVDDAGSVKPPFIWDDDRRLRLRAKLDAVFFHLYGVTDRDDIQYVYSTFPIVERQEIEAYGRYASRDLCLGYVNALAAGDPDAEIAL